MVEYTVESGRPVILLFESGSKDRDEPKKIYGFKPYIRIPKDVPIGGRVTLEDKFGRERKILLDSEEDNVPLTIDGTITKKLFTPLPSDVKLLLEQQLRPHDIRSFEDDVLYQDRYLIDKVQIPIKKAPIKILHFDIEVDTEGGFESTRTAKKPIISISLKTNGGEPTVVLFWQHPDYKQKIPKPRGNHIYKEFKSELAVLNAFFAFINHHQPDIIYGQNIENYDLPYLYYRCRNIGARFERISPLGYIKENNGKIIIPGRTVFDMMVAYAIANPSEPKNLDAICEKAGIAGKSLPGGGSQTGHYWRNDIGEFLHYSATDTDKLDELEEIYGYVDFYDEIHRFVGCQLKDVFGRMKMGETYIMKQVPNEWAFPSRSEMGGEDYRGVPPLETITGMHKNGAILDVESMHPTIQRSHNLSPETVTIKDGEIVSVSENEGFMVKITNKLLELKAHFYRLRDESEPGSEAWKEAKRKADVVKQIMNTTSYGLFGAPHSRLYCRPIAKKITEKSVEYLNLMDSECEIVVAGDTDSVHALLKTDVTKDLDKAVLEAKDMAALLTSKLQTQSTKGEYFKVGLDIIYSNSIYRAKKRYALRVVWDNGPVDRIEVKGLDVKRGNCSPFTKTLQKTILKKLLYDKSQQSISDYIKEMIDVHKSKTIHNIRDVALPMKVHKRYDLINNPWSRGALYANKHLSANHKRGDRLLLLLLNKKKQGKWANPQRPTTSEICLDESGYISLPQELHDSIDWKKMQDRNIVFPSKRVLEVCNIDYNSLLSCQKDIGEWLQ